jgi:competence protein ComEC
MIQYNPKIKRESMFESILKTKIMHFRPVFLVAIFLSFGILFGYLPKQSTVLLVGLLCLCLFIVIFSYIKNKSLPLLLVYLLSFATGILLINLQTNLDIIPTAECTIKGRVVSVDHYEYSSTYILKDCEIIADEPVVLKQGIKLNSKDDRLRFGDTISAKAQLSYFKPATNFFGFDARKYYLSENIGMTATSKQDKIMVISNTVKLDTYFYNLRNTLTQNIKSLYNKETFGIATGLLVGEKGDIDFDTYKTFQRGGAASILAVSGLHFTIILAFLFFALTLLRIHRKWAMFVCAIFMIIYAGVVGFTISATRALIMCLTFIISKLLARKSDMLSILSFAFIVCLVLNPISIFRIGFILSFGAVFAIIMLTEIFQSKMNKLPNKLSSLLAVSLSASIGTAPLVINFFSYFSLIGVVANIIIIPVASITVVAVMISAVLGPTLGIPFAFVGQNLILFMQKTMAFLLKIPFSSIAIKSLPVFFIILWFFLIFFVSKHCLINQKSKKILVIIIVVIMIVALIIPAFEAENLEVYFFDIGQGDAVLIKTADEKIYMVDCGKNYEYRHIEDYLLKNGYRLDGLFISHSDSDHAGGLLRLVSNGFVDKVYVSKPDLINFKDDPNITFIPLQAGMRVDLDEDTFLDILYPDFSEKEKDANKMSLVMVLNHNNYKVLLTGEIDKPIERKILALVADVDILKVSHHGSKNSSSEQFLKQANAQYAVISSGENGFGHPSAQTLYNLQKYCDIILRTDEKGGILFTFSDKIDVTTVLK